VALVTTDVSEERITSIIWVERISKLGTLAVPWLQLLVPADAVPNMLILSTLMMEAKHSSKTSVLRESHGIAFQAVTFFN
jgi:hypothetical protein